MKLEKIYINGEWYYQFVMINPNGKNDVGDLFSDLEEADYYRQKLIEQVKKYGRANNKNI